MYLYLLDTLNSCLCKLYLRRIFWKMLVLLKPGVLWKTCKNRHEIAKKWPKPRDLGPYMFLFDHIDEFEFLLNF